MNFNKEHKLVKLICKNEEELNSCLTEKKEIIKKFKDCQSEYYSHINSESKKASAIGTALG